MNGTSRVVALRRKHVERVAYWRAVSRGNERYMYAFCFCGGLLKFSLTGGIVVIS